jgi:tetratricopeptide (TPR) repeat protein
MSAAPPGPKPESGPPAGGVDAGYDRGMRLLEGGDFLAALPLLRTVMEAVPGNEQIVRTLLRLGRGAAQAALALPVQTPEAAELYECSLAGYLATGSTISGKADCDLLRAVCFNLGAYYHGRALYPQAIRHYQDALLLNPDHDDAPNNLAQVLIEDGQPLEALAMLTAAMQRHPKSAVLQHRKEQALKAAGRPQ